MTLQIQPAESRNSFTLPDPERYAAARKRIAVAVVAEHAGARPALGQYNRRLAALIMETGLADHEAVVELARINPAMHANYYGGPGAIIAGAGAGFRTAAVSRAVADGGVAARTPSSAPQPEPADAIAEFNREVASLEQAGKTRSAAIRTIYEKHHDLHSRFLDAVNGRSATRPGRLVQSGLVTADYAEGTAATDEWNSAVAAKRAALGDERLAIRAVVQEQPALHAAYLLEFNARNRAAGGAGLGNDPGRADQISSGSSAVDVTNSGTSDPESEWNAAVAVKVKAGMTTPRAIAAVVKENPDLHERYVATYNDRNQRDRSNKQSIIARG
jgi:hypothetical protein